MILKEGQCPGLTAEVIQALRTQNIRTVVDLVTADAEELSCKCSLSYKTLAIVYLPHVQDSQTLVAINRVLLAQYASFPINGADLYDELLSSTAILSTGNESLDKLLDSGLYTGEVTELIGSPGSGKTQVCLGVAANVACELKRNVVYIDSTGGLSASRLLEIVKSKVSTAEQQLDALRRIYVTEVFDIFSMLKVLQTLRTGGFPESPSGSSSLKAVIVDSVRAVLLPVIGGNQIEGLSLMMQLAGELRMISRDFCVAVLVTNHVIRESNGAVKPGLGRSWSHVPRTRILLQHVNSEMTTQNGLRRATLLKSSRQPCQISEEFCLGSWNHHKVVKEAKEDSIPEEAH